MNLKTIKNMSLKLVNQYTNNGQFMSISENADYLNKMNELANDCQMEISKIKRLIGLKIIYQTDSTEEGYNQYTLPLDFIELKRIDLDNTLFIYYKLDRGKIFIPKSISGEFKIYYYKRPEEITVNTPDEYELEIDYDLQGIIPYYIASYLIAEDNPGLSNRFLIEYSNKIMFIRDSSNDNFKTIPDVYGW